jgi:hopanoid-associated phosphorylase
MGETGILCGFAAEAKAAASIPSARVAMSGARADLARERAEVLIGEGAERLLSFGLAGALDPSLTTGDLIVGKEIYTADERWVCDAAWQADLLARLPAARGGIIWGADRVIAEAAAKKDLFTQTKAQIVDMESHIVAAVAAKAGIPFAVLRVVVDPQEMSLPPLALNALDEAGKPDIARILCGLFCDPLQIGGLIKLGNKTKRAMEELNKACGQGFSKEGTK